MTLYNLKIDGDQYRITKFTNDLEVESSYLLTETECECPAGSRSSCRHRQMLPIMLSFGMANTAMFYDFETRVVLEQTFDSTDEVEAEPLAEVEAEVADIPTDADGNIDYAAIAEPCGFASQPHSTTVSASDFDSEDGGSNPPEVAKFHPSIGPIKRRI